VRKPAKGLPAAPVSPAAQAITVSGAESVAARPAPVLVPPEMQAPPTVEERPAPSPAEFAPAEDETLTIAETAQSGQATAQQGPSPRLAREADVVDAPSIGPKTAERFYKAGVRTVDDLLNAAPDEVARRLEARHISAQVVRDWQAQALLACTVPGLSGTGAQLLVACGVRDADALAGVDADAMAEKIRVFAATSDGQSVLRSGRPPATEQIRTWIDNARGIVRRAAA
jgi:predicted flap endonuclease-1-like 5' DNA nuclease